MPFVIRFCKNWSQSNKHPLNGLEVLGKIIFLFCPTRQALSIGIAKPECF